MYVFFWVTAALDTRTEVRELHQSPAVYRMYLVEDCRSNLLFESCWEVELEVGDCVCVSAREEDKWISPAQATAAH